jgi:hypothetical protein
VALRAAGLDSFGEATREVASLLHENFPVFVFDSEIGLGPTDHRVAGLDSYLASLFCVEVLSTVDGHSHSANDTLIRNVSLCPPGACALL